MTEQRVVIYRGEDGAVSVNAVVQDGTMWLTQKGMAMVFDVQPQAVSRHLANIFAEGELAENRTSSILELVQNEGGRLVKRKAMFYNLDAVIAVGYRVNSRRATHFRIWATGVLREYMIKGFALDDERLKNGEPFGKDYFRELLERVRSIRASERRIWQQVTDIFAECSIDYDKNSPITRNFYAMVQNKFHYAITGKTAAEIIDGSADRNKEHMGLTTWKNAPDGRVLKSDVVVAKNYLSADEIRRLERIVSGFFDYIEGIIERENTFTMEEFAKCVDAFISFNRYDVLQGKGQISKDEADEKAKAEYDVFNKTQKIDSDFDKAVREALKAQHND